MFHLNRVFIFKEQSYGQMVFSFRYNSDYEKVKMVLNQLLRVFLTRKDPFAKQAINNTYFHLSREFHLKFR